jgi:hypothetical protein
MRGRLRDRVEADAARLLRERVERLRRSLDGALADLSAPPEFPLSPGDWGAAEGTAHLQTVRDAVEAIARGASQREILTALLDGAAAFYPRTALFIARGPTLSGWAGLGFLGEGGVRSEDLSRAAFPLSGSHLLAQAAQRHTMVRAGAEGPGAELEAALGKVRPGGACASPLLVRGRTVAVLYGDTGSSEGETSTEGLAFDLLTRVAGLAMERIAAARRPHPPGPAEETGGAAGPRPAAPHPSTPSPLDEAEMLAILGDLDQQGRRTASDDGLSDEERRRLADARRFAHLLVSEIMLYNEQAVIQGRKHRDLMQRLQKEIDRSRQAYRARVSGLVSRTPDFFEEELVRQLAQGDPRLLRN